MFLFLQLRDLSAQHCQFETKIKNTKKEIEELSRQYQKLRPREIEIQDELYSLKNEVRLVKKNHICFDNTQRRSPTIHICMVLMRNCSEAEEKKDTTSSVLIASSTTLYCHTMHNTKGCFWDW